MTPLANNATAGMGLVPYVVLAAYLLVLVGLGWVGYRRSRTGEEDYYLAGRRQGWIVSSLTIMATFFSSFALLGAPAMVYREGVVFALFSLNVPVAGLCVYLLGAKIRLAGRRRGYLTPADMVADYYGSPVGLRLLVALTGVLYAIPYVMMQIKAGGDVSAVLFGGHRNAFEVGATVLAVITTVYIMVGGMRSVAWTDVLQGLLLMGGMLIAGAAVIASFGGLGAFGEAVCRRLPVQSLTLPGTTGQWQWSMLLSVCVLASSGSMVQPAQWMRYYAARDTATLRRAAVVFAVALTACFMLGIMFVGLGGQALYPLEHGPHGVTANRHVGSFDRILVVVLQDRLPPLLGPFGLVVASLVIVAIMAASMSTADSNLHALSAVAVRDVYDRFLRPRAGQQERVWVGRAVIVLATAVSLALVIEGEWGRRAGTPHEFMQMIALLGFTAIAFSSQLLPVTIDMLYLRRGTRAGAISGLVAGLAAAFLFSDLFPVVAEWAQGLGQPAAAAAGGLLRLVQNCQHAVPMHASAWGMLVNVPAFALVSRFSRPVPQRRRDEFAALMLGGGTD